ncbi:hypothetical protein AgCh_001232 [Apium graveolens]
MGKKQEPGGKCEGVACEITEQHLGKNMDIHWVPPTNGTLKIHGTIPNLTPLACQLWEIHVGLRGFVERANSVILETDNMAYGTIQFAHLHQHPEVEDLIQQILVRLRDPNWNCSFRFVYSARNRVTEYASLMGGELFCRSGRLGINDPQFLEAPMVEEEAEVFGKLWPMGLVMLADAFMENVRINAPWVDNDVPHMHDVVHEEYLDADDIFDLF